MKTKMNPTSLSKPGGGVVKSTLKPRLRNQPCKAYGKNGALPQKMTNATFPKVKGTTKGRG